MGSHQHSKCEHGVWEWLILSPCEGGESVDFVLVAMINASSHVGQAACRSTPLVLPRIVSTVKGIPNSRGMATFMDLLTACFYEGLSRVSGATFRRAPPPKPQTPRCAPYFCIGPSNKAFKSSSPCAGVTLPSKCSRTHAKSSDENFRFFLLRARIASAFPCHAVSFV